MPGLLAVDVGANKLRPGQNTAYGGIYNHSMLFTWEPEVTELNFCSVPVAKDCGQNHTVLQKHGKNWDHGPIAESVTVMRIFFPRRVIFGVAVLDMIVALVHLKPVA